MGAAAADFQLATGRMPLKNHTAEAVSASRPQYTDAEIEQIAAYVGSLGPGPAIPTNLNYQSADARVRRRAVPHQLRAVPQLRRLGR